MVSSKINNLVNYIEETGFKIEDNDFETAVDTVEIYPGLTIDIALGKANYVYEPKGVVFFPIYVISGNAIVKNPQIGVYEIPKERVLSVFDPDGYAILEFLGDPLLYTFADKEYIEKLVDTEIVDLVENMSLQDKNIQVEDKSPAEEEAPEEYDSDDESPFSITAPSIKHKAFDNKIFENITNKVPPTTLEEETSGTMKEINKKYVTQSDYWLVNYMKNDNYGVIDNEGGGDCLFAAIRDAFIHIGKQTTVSKLRTALSEQATVEVFENYRSLYQMYKETIDADKKQLKQLSATHSDLKRQFHSTTSKSDHLDLVKRGKEIEQQHDDLKMQIEATKKMARDYEFMKGVDTLEKFKYVVTTCKFWGELWSISVLEKVLNVKLIVLSETAYVSNDKFNVVQCGEDTGHDINPLYYIMLNYDGSHYKLVTYRNKRILEFKELPYDMKSRIVNKCMEKNAGPFNRIPEFRKFKSEEFDIEEDLEDISDTVNDTYNPEVVLQFYSKSESKPPGKGVGDKVPDNMEIKKNLLLLNEKYKDWRRKLSGAYPAEIEIDDLKWATVDHYVLGARYKRSRPDVFRSFSTVNNWDLSTAKKEIKNLEKKHIRPDTDFDESLEIEHATKAKFTQHTDLKEMLLLTENAKLVQFVQKKPPIVAHELMRVRKELNA